MAWDVEYVKGSTEYFMLRNRANRELCLATAKEIGSSGKVALAYPCENSQRFHWYFERPEGTERQCFETKAGDFAWCDCDLVIGTDEEGAPFLATTAYTDAQSSIPNDINLVC